MKTWKDSNIENAKYLGIIEFHDNKDEWHNFELMETDEKLVFGGCCNVGFIESGYIEKDGFDTDTVLQTLIEELAVYYNDGKDYVSCIICNERM
jgi:hypothetical protein